MRYASSWASTASPTADREGCSRLGNGPRPPGVPHSPPARRARRSTGPKATIPAGLALNPLPPARRMEMEHRAQRHDPGRIERAVALVIVALDVSHVDGLGDPRRLVEVAQIARQVGIVGDPAQIAFEMPDIDGVEAHERGEEAPIGFGVALAHEVAPFRQALVEPVERL